MREEYFGRVYAAVTYIEAHLDQALQLPEIAEHAGYSAFHFCRVFQGLTGESVMEYVRKRRLTQAACALVQTPRRILDIAVEYQYDSQEAFTRTFKRAYGMTPGAYRRRRRFMPLCPPLTRALLMAPLPKGVSMEPQFVSLDAFTVVGLEYIGKNEHMEIPALWDQFNPRGGEISHKHEPWQFLGVCSCVEGDGVFSYVAGCRVDAVHQVPAGMVAREVPAAKYAVFTHRGPLFGVEMDLSSTYAYIYREWLPNSGYTRAETPDFELYDDRFAFGQAHSEMDIYIPIRE